MMMMRQLSTIFLCLQERERESNTVTNIYGQLARQLTVPLLITTTTTTFQLNLDRLKRELGCWRLMPQWQTVLSAHCFSIQPRLSGCLATTNQIAALLIVSIKSVCGLSDLVRQACTKRNLIWRDSLWVSERCWLPFCLLSLLYREVLLRAECTEEESY